MTPDTRYSIKCRTTDTGEDKCLVMRGDTEVSPADELSREEAQARADKLNSKLLLELVTEAKKRHADLLNEYQALEASIKARDLGRGGR